MKKRILTWLTCSLTFASPAFAGLFPKVVDALDIDSYQGRWYEVASTHPSSQKDCVCVTADYTLIDDETLSITNSCRKKTPDGMLDIVEGEAKTTKNPGKLKVDFGGLFSPLFSNYWVVDLAEDYRYAVVTTAWKKPIWILARTQRLNQEDMGGILGRLHDAFYDLRRLSLTVHENCVYTGE